MTPIKKMRKGKKSSYRGAQTGFLRSKKVEVCLIRSRSWVPVTWCKHYPPCAIIPLVLHQRIASLTATGSAILAGASVAYGAEPQLPQLPPPQTTIPTAALDKIAVSWGSERLTSFRADAKKISLSYKPSSIHSLTYERSLLNEPYASNLNVNLRLSPNLQSKFSEVGDVKGLKRAFETNLAQIPGVTAQYRWSQNQAGTPQATDNQTFSLKLTPSPKSSLFAQLDKNPTTSTSLIQASTTGDNSNFSLTQKTSEAGQSVTKSIDTTLKTAGVSANYTWSSQSTQTTTTEKQGIALSVTPKPDSAIQLNVSNDPGATTSFFDAKTKSEGIQYQITQKTIDFSPERSTEMTSFSISSDRIAASLTQTDSVNGSSSSDSTSKQLTYSSLKNRKNFGMFTLVDVTGGITSTEVGDSLAKEEFTTGVRALAFGGDLGIDTRRSYSQGGQDLFSHQINFAKRAGPFSLSTSMQERFMNGSLTNVSESYGFNWGFDRLTSISYQSVINPTDPQGNLLPRQHDIININRKLTPQTGLTLELYDKTDNSLQLRDRGSSLLLNGLFANQSGLKVGYSFRELQPFGRDTLIEHGIRFDFQRPSKNNSEFKLGSTIGIRNGDAAVTAELMYKLKF
jgi:hypothetical protein